MKIRSRKEIEHGVSDAEITAQTLKRAKDEITNQRFMEQISAGFAQIESRNTRVTDIVINASTFSGIRASSRDVLDMNTQRRLLDTGLIATLWGADLWVTRECAVDEVKIYGEDDPALGVDFPTIYENKQVIRGDRMGMMNAAANSAELPQPTPKDELDSRAIEGPQIQKHELLADDEKGDDNA